MFVTSVPVSLFPLPPSPSLPHPTPRPASRPSCWRTNGVGVMSSPSITIQPPPSPPQTHFPPCSFPPPSPRPDPTLLLLELLPHVGHGDDLDLGEGPVRVQLHHA